ncbi:uncharacterized protein LOC143032881 isoform X2 [Oratosquilla oratoria]|uniref:uncharacterized protein LOC143032881 isoform X2 n=1 Tax=Oratosquilla oratoria TaxID=337810 RepID=UPI003F75C8E6
MDMKYKYQAASQGRSENYERMDRRVKWLTIVATLMTLVAVASLAMSVYVGYEMVFGKIKFTNCNKSDNSLLQQHQQEMQKMREQLQILTVMVTTMKEASLSRDKTPPRPSPGSDSDGGGGTIRQGAPSNVEITMLGPPVKDVTQSEQMDVASSSTTSPHEHIHDHHHHHAESSNSHQHDHTENSSSTSHQHHHHAESSTSYQHDHTESSTSHQHPHTETSTQHQHQSHHHHHKHHHGGAVPIDESSGDGMNDDEDYQDFEFGSGEVDCPPFPKPYCPVGRRVCLTKERCPRPVCC